MVPAHHRNESCLTGSTTRAIIMEMMKPIRRTPLRQSRGLEAPPLRLAGTAHGSGPLVWER